MATKNEKTVLDAGEVTARRTGSVSKTIFGTTSNALVAYAAAQRAYVVRTLCGRGVATLMSLNRHSTSTPDTQNTMPPLHTGKMSA